ncbi:MAG: hypothetical protein D6732_12025 [Methanobacteriota archaeon]|nr:MAG: hypothetical protein D6732_12025 [Euryarchaeota archaeon]
MIGGYRTTIEFETKLDGNRFYIPVKFDEVRMGSIIHFVVTERGEHTFSSTKVIRGKVSNKRIVTIPKEFLPDEKEVRITIFEIFNPVEIQIRKEFQGRISTRKTVKLPNALRANTDDLLFGKVIANVTQGFEFDPPIPFTKKVIAGGKISLPLEQDQFKPKDRIRFAVEKMIQSPDNLALDQTRKPINLDWVVGIVDNPPLIYFTSNPLSKPPGIDLSIKERMSGKDEIIEIEMDAASYSITLFWKDSKAERLIFLQCIVEVDEENLAELVQALVNFKRSQLELLGFDDISPNMLDIKYNKFLDSLNNPNEEDKRVVPPFSPKDIFDREKFDIQEATVLSVILARLIEGKSETKIDEFNNYHLQFDPKPVISSLQSRGFLAKKIRDDEVVYSIPHFYLKESMQFFEAQQSLLLIIHSFGGGVAKTTLAVNMAKRLSELGMKCVLIDLDFISSRIGEIFVDHLTSSDHKYLDEFLEGRIKADSLIATTEFANLNLILTDPREVNLQMKAIGQNEASRLLERYISLFNFLRERYDIIIVDAEGSLDFNIMNVFLLADLALILSNGNRSSLEGLKKRVSLILQRIGLGIRNDILIQTLVPPSRIEMAKENTNRWSAEFNMEGISVYPEPIEDEMIVKEQIFDDQYFVEESAKLSSWINNFLRSNTRMQIFLRNKNYSI